MASSSNTTPLDALPRLRPCPSSPNCVSSLEERAARRVEPLRFEGEPGQAWDRLRALVATQPRATIAECEGPYLRAVFRTRWLRFRDDVEFLLDTASRCIHVRSASRIGYSDLGANRRRVEALRKHWLSSPSNKKPPDLAR